MPQWDRSSCLPSPVSVREDPITTRLGAKTLFFFRHDVHEGCAALLAKSFPGPGAVTALSGEKVTHCLVLPGCDRFRGRGVCWVQRTDTPGGGQRRCRDTEPESSLDTTARAGRKKNVPFVTCVTRCDKV